MELNNIFQQPDNRVGKFTSIVCEEPDQAIALNTLSTALNMPMYQLAEEFITKSLNIGPNHPHRWNQIALLKAAMEYTVDMSGTDGVDALVADQKLGAEVAEKIRFLIQCSLAEQRTKDQQALAEAQQQGQAAVREEVFNSSDPPPAAKKRRINGVGEIDGRDCVAKCGTVKEKIEKLLELEVPHGGKGLNESAKTFLSKTMRPALGCLHNHFNGDVDAFSTAWEGNGKKFVMSKFMAKCCKGVAGGTCGGKSS
jgi:hypothetical protein